MSRAVALLLVMVTAVLSAGCGQKRDLVLPDAPPEIDSSVAPAEGRTTPPPSAP